MDGAIESVFPMPKILISGTRNMVLGLFGRMKVCKFGCESGKLGYVCFYLGSFSLLSSHSLSPEAFCSSLSGVQPSRTIRYRPGTRLEDSEPFDDIGIFDPVTYKEFEFGFHL